jgi:hypothetical protein
MTPTTQKRTHTPWVVSEYEASPQFRSIQTHVAVCTEDGALLATCGPAYDPQSVLDAKAIALAVNAHEELLEAAREMAAFLDKDFSHSMLAAKIRKAIAKAEQ